MNFGNGGTSEDKLKDKVIITCALSGAVANRTQCPYIPYTPEEYAAEAKRAYEAGCTVVHIHARRPDGTPSYLVEDFRNIVEAIKAEVPDMIINLSTGAVGLPREQRIAHVLELKPDIAALNMGTMNYAKYSPKRKNWVFAFEFINSIWDIEYFIECMVKVGTKPECECFDLGHIETIYPLMDKGLLKIFQVSIILGVVGGASADPRNLVYLSTRVPPGVEWQVIGISREQWPLVMQSVLLGGHARVGFEDNFYLPDGRMAKSNGELVEAAARIIREVGKEVATPEEARKILKLEEARKLAQAK
jgi:uncharacterized protein (DUF849 family)